MRLSAYNTLAPLLLGPFCCPSCGGRLVATGDQLDCRGCGASLAGYESVVQLGPSVPHGGRWHRAEPAELLERFGALDVEAVEAWLSTWLRPADGPVVDVYGGTGVWVRQLARWFGAARVLSLEPDHALATAAQRDPRDPGLAYVSGPLTRWPFRDDSVGGVVCMALHRAPDLDAFFLELRRVLAPGGSAAVMTPLQAPGWVGGVQLGLGVATGVRFVSAETLRDHARAVGLEVRALLPSRHLGLMAVRRLQ